MQCTVLRLAVLAPGLLVVAPAGEALAGGRREPVPDGRVALDVLVMDGSTGSEVRGAKVAFRPAEGAESRPLVVGHGVHRLEATGLQGGESLSYRLDLELPPGWVQETVSDHDPAPPRVSIFTRTVVRTLVAWPEARIRVKVLDAAGAPVAGASLHGERPAAGRRFLRGNRWSCSRQAAEPRDSFLGKGSTGSDGTGFLTGIPAIPGLLLKATAYGEDRSGESEPIRIGDPRALMEFVVRLPPGAGGHGGGFGFGVGRG